ncbi:MAG: thiamine-phosphate kinase [Candidatus Syntrophonatronum acetioxidans]|uniref:Thiamine-monophosphate kinase n=1 Tax=Candidatus Syntrophonatronum acetioxidans TaxID=1795816 RepID=A0A424YA86_9FIRM|nr:MAG: thiamine-phosphate kinase [Candidatus Syntrophonatronum acetioxidans]
MLISHLGEVELIKKISRQFPLQEKGVRVGIGDDAAVLSPLTDAGRLTLVTKDILVEGVHFLSPLITPYQLGRKALAVNISDIAAMGGVPRHLVTAVGFPLETELKKVEEIYRGMGDLCRTFSINLIGGDTVKSPEGIIISVTLLGEVEEDCLLLRSGAKPGDLLGVTGELGSSAAGLDLLLEGSREEKREVEDYTSWFQILTKFHLEPPLRLQEARRIARSHLVTSMIDLSDGIMKDLGEISRASQVGAKVYLDRVPLSSALKKASSFLGKDPLDYALGGGEDYELLFTFKGGDKEKIEELAKGFQIPVSIIGEITPPEEGIKYLDKEGKERNFSRKGYTHF